VRRLNRKSKGGAEIESLEPKAFERHFVDRAPKEVVEETAAASRL